MIVLKIIGYVLRGILALIVLALCIKVKIFAEYSAVDTHVKLKWLFLEIPLYPMKKKEKNGEEKQKSDKAEENNEIQEDTDSENTEEASESTEEDTPTASDGEEKKKKSDNHLLKTIYEAHGIDGLLLIVKRVFSYIGTFLGDLLKSVVIEELYMDVKCHKNDAASTAIYYGEICSALFPMLGALVTKYKVKKYDVNVYPDFLAKHSDASFAVSLHLYPIYVIGITLALVFKLIFKVLVRLFVKCFRVNKKSTEKNTPDSHTESAA